MWGLKRMRHSNPIDIHLRLGQTQTGIMNQYWLRFLIKGGPRVPHHLSLNDNIRRWLLERRRRRRLICALDDMESLAFYMLAVGRGRHCLLLISSRSFVLENFCATSVHISSHLAPKLPLQNLIF